MFVADFRQKDAVCFFIDPVIAFTFFGLLALEFGRNDVHPGIKLDVVIGRSGDDQRGTGFVDQNGVDFIDHGEGQGTLNAVFGALDHVVAEVVKTKFIVGAVSDAGGVGLGAGNPTEVFEALVIFSLVDII